MSKSETHTQTVETVQPRQVAKKYHNAPEMREANKRWQELIQKSIKMRALPPVTHEEAERLKREWLAKNEITQCPTAYAAAINNGEGQ